MRAVDLRLFAICVILSSSSAAVNGFTFNTKKITVSNTKPTTVFPSMMTSSGPGNYLGKRALWRSKQCHHTSVVFSDVCDRIYD